MDSVPQLHTSNTSLYNKSLHQLVYNAPEVFCTYWLIMHNARAPRRRFLVLQPLLLFQLILLRIELRHLPAQHPQVSFSSFVDLCTCHLVLNFCYLGLNLFHFTAYCEIVKKTIQ